MIHPAAEDLLCAAAGERVGLMARRSREGMGDVLTVREAAKYVRLTLPMDINIDPHKITAVIIRDALDELGLRVGDTAVALVKATEVMVIKD